MPSNTTNVSLDNFSNVLFSLNSCALAPHLNLNIESIDGNTITANADYVLLTNKIGKQKIISFGNITGDLSNTINSIGNRQTVCSDNESRTMNKWYSVWVMANNQGGEISLLFSNTYTNPIPDPAYTPGASWPEYLEIPDTTYVGGNYEYFGFIGNVYNQNNNEIRRFWQKNKNVQWKNQVKVVKNAGNGTEDDWGIKWDGTFPISSSEAKNYTEGSYNLEYRDAEIPHKLFTAGIAFPPTAITIGGIISNRTADASNDHKIEHYLIMSPTNESSLWTGTKNNFSLEPGKMIYYNNNVDDSFYPFEMLNVENAIYFYWYKKGAHDFEAWISNYSY